MLGYQLGRCCCLPACQARLGSSCSWRAAGGALERPLVLFQGPGVSSCPSTQGPAQGPEALW